MLLSRLHLMILSAMCMGGLAACEGVRIDEGAVVESVLEDWAPLGHVATNPVLLTDVTVGQAAVRPEPYGYEDRPASAAGIELGDCVVSVNGQTTSDRTASEVNHDMATAALGTSFELVIERQGEQTTVSLDIADLLPLR